MSLFPLVSVAAAVFAITNIDDALILAAFFADPGFRTYEVVVGQYIGIGALVVVSASAGALAIALPQGYTALLGLAPLALGAWRMRALFRPDQDDETAPPHRGRLRMFEVAAATIAGGGDNLAAYVPMFARTPTAIPVYAAVFAVLTGLWCVIGRTLVSSPVFGRSLRIYGRRLLPFVLIALGIWVLAGARALFR